MSDMFKNYTDENLSGKYKISNEKEDLPLEKEFWNEIIIGAPNSYSYTLDLENKKYRKDDIESVCVTYVQGTKPLISKIIPNENIYSYNIGLVTSKYYIKVNWEISVVESFLFNVYNRNVFGQIKTTYKDGNIIYSPLLKHAVRANLDDIINEATS